MEPGQPRHENGAEEGEGAGLMADLDLPYDPVGGDPEDRTLPAGFDREGRLPSQELLRTKT